MTFSGKNVLITGARGGLGRALIEGFAKQGANVYAAIRKSDDEFSNFCRNISDKFRVQIQILCFDMTDIDSMKTVIKETIFKNKIKIDVLVNNAGVAHGGFFQMTPISKIKEVFEINLFSHMEITQLILKTMVKNGSGSIINLSSIAGMDLAVGNSAYGVSKAAIAAWTKTLAAEVGPLGVRINAVAPSLVDTQMAEKMEEKARIDMINQSAMKRLATPEEVANVILFLASDSASFVNGQIIRIDGGKK